MLRIFEKKVFGGYKSQIFFIGAKMQGVVTSHRQFRGAWRSLCKSGGSEVIFAEIMAPLHPLPRWINL